MPRPKDLLSPSALLGPIALIASCLAPSSTPPAPSTGPLALPGACGRVERDLFYYVFREDAVERRSQGRAEEFFEVPPGSGAPAAVGIDYQQGLAGVAYERGLAIQLLGSMDGPLWVPAAWKGTPASLALANGLAATLAGSTVAFYTLPDAQFVRAFDMSGWMDDHDLSVAHFAFPLSEDEFLFVGFKGMGLLEDSSVRVQRITAARGDLREVASASLDGLSWLQASAADGRSLFLAGTAESRLRTAANPMGQLVQTLRVFRVNSETLFKEELITEERHETQVVVRHLASGDGVLALSLAGGQVLAYRMEGDGSYARVWSKHFSANVAPAWLSADRLLLIPPVGEPFIERIDG